MDENELSKVIIGAAIEVHRELGGPGLLESLYEEALVFELMALRIPCQRQIGFPVIYKGHELERRLVLDLLVSDLIIVEVKATEENLPIHEAQLLTYLRQTNKRLGLVLNFGQKMLKDGLRRVVNGL